MTISTTVSKNIHNGNGTTTTFAFEFKILDQLHLEVYLVVAGVLVKKTLTSDYTVTGVGVSGGGTVVFNVAPPAGTGNVVIRRLIPATQLVNYITNDDFPSETHEGALDKLTMLIQQQQEQLDRAVKLALDDTTDPLLLVESIFTASDEAIAAALTATEQAVIATTKADEAAASAAQLPNTTGGADTVPVVNATADGWLYKTAAQFLTWLNLLSTVNIWSAVQKSTVTTNNTLSHNLAVEMDVVCTPTAGGALEFTNIAVGQKFEILFTNTTSFAFTKGSNIKCSSTFFQTISTTGRYRISGSCLDGTNVDLDVSAAHV